MMTCKEQLQPPSIAMLALTCVLVTGCHSARRALPSSVTSSIATAAPTLEPEILSAAVAIHHCAVQQGMIRPRRRQPHMAIVDFDIPSTQRRLWVVDLVRGDVVHHEWVAHGDCRDGQQFPNFSDEDGSHCSSVGSYATAEPYTGKHGLSLRLDGLEKGFNGNARSRDIVVHGADYVSEDHIAAYGRLGRSWGCPAVRQEVSTSIVERMAHGGLLLIWSTDHTWYAESELLACARQQDPTIPPRTPAPIEIPNAPPP